MERRRGPRLVLVRLVRERADVAGVVAVRVGLGCGFFAVGWGCSFFLVFCGRVDIVSVEWSHQSESARSAPNTHPKKTLKRLTYKATSHPSCPHIPAAQGYPSSTPQATINQVFVSTK